MSLFLTDAELEELTHRRRSDAQRRELDFMAIPYRVRRDESLAVLRIHVLGTADANIPSSPEPELMP